MCFNLFLLLLESCWNYSFQALIPLQLHLFYYLSHVNK